MAAVAGEAPERRTSTAEKAIDRAPSTAARTGRSARATKGLADGRSVTRAAIRTEPTGAHRAARGATPATCSDRRREGNCRRPIEARVDAELSHRYGHLPVQRHRGLHPARRTAWRRVAKAPRGPSRDPAAGHRE